MKEELFIAFFSASDPLGLCLMRPHRVCDYLADIRAEEADRSQAPLTSDWTGLFGRWEDCCHLEY